MAREVGAAVLEERNEFMGSSYNAHWEGVAPVSEEAPHAIGMYSTGKGMMILCIPIDSNKYVIGNYLTIDKVNFAPQQLEQHYLGTLQSIPELWVRLKDAKQVSDVVGMKGIQNGYRQPYGEGWALVGDALHYKDLLDGQGIYDALLGAKLLAAAIREWKAGGMSYEQAMEGYKAKFWEGTHAMFLQTVTRIKQEIYTYPPPFIIKTLVRWMINDPEYQAKYLRYSHRLDEPAISPPLLPKYLWRGLMRDLRK